MLYVHIPFCKHLCAYCDFYFSVSLQRKEQMFRALLREMEVRIPTYNQQTTGLNTLYFGGGTPSVLTPSELSQLIEKAKKLLNVNSFLELTVEVNPDDISSEYVTQLREIGVDRLSIGVQSFRDEQLKNLRRRHSAKQAIESVEKAQAAGFTNITIDLMYGLPEQTMSDWQRDVEQALALGVPHISAYLLTIEPNTIFGKQQAQNLLSLPSEEMCEAQFLYLHDRLEQAGYEHYEVSNFAQKNFRAKHNSGYWKGFSYLGIGPSAHSFDGENRHYNIANNIRYLEAVENNLPTFESEKISKETRFNEYLLVSLRTVEGGNLQHIHSTFGESFAEHCLQQAQPYLCSGKLIKTDYQLHISPRQFLLSDSIIRDLFWV